MVLQQFQHKSQCGLLTPALLNQDVENYALTINSSPQIHLFAADILVKGRAGGHGALSEIENARFDEYFLARFILYEQNYRIWSRDPTIFTITYLRRFVVETTNADTGPANKGSRE